ncbi:longitudinals lacking protein, isoforms A/B/D/L-like [Homalodisca vitripennis]|uniref:longitudinals lacking protein, isoforms A/B/D/L-like n=1 Tax=Homalodisca vitripennis TaxID=197043 RepID=UPI001EEC811D|nr:longitudinals lacking protein, isoforms A/B/D/L-like [Homalodisca vitripennis]
MTYEPAPQPSSTWPQDLGLQPEPQAKPRPVFLCPGCSRPYSWRQSMLLHYKNACGKEPQFQCPHCPYRAKQKGNLDKHIEIKHSARTLTIL